MKKLTAFLLCFGLLLCGCSGNTDEAVASQAPETASVETSEASIADASLAEPDPAIAAAELGMEIWNKAIAAEKAAYAYDYDISMYMEVDMDGTVTTSQTTYREKVIDSEDMQSMYTGIDSEILSLDVWYADGYVYSKSDTGSFKAPMTVEEYLAAYGEETASSDSVLELDPSNFDYVYGMETEQGYSLTFREPKLETWMAFSGLLSVDETATCEEFTLEGYMECDENGNVTTLKLEMGFVMDILGTPMSMFIRVNQRTMGYNESVNLMLPTDDPSFIEMPDLSLPSVISASQIMMQVLPSLSFECVYAVTLSDAGGSDGALQIDSVNYTTDAEGVTGRILSEVIQRGETVYVEEDVYAYGSGTITTPDEEIPYDYSDADFIADAASLYLSYWDSFGYGSDYTLTEGDGVTTLTYNLSEEYIHTNMADGLAWLDVSHFLTDGTVTSTEGTFVIIFDNSGLPLSHVMTLTIVVDYEGVPVTLTLENAAEILSLTGDAVSGEDTAANQ